jgi:hypothetical protein
MKPPLTDVRVIVGSASPRRSTSASDAACAEQHVQTMRLLSSRDTKFLSLPISGWDSAASRVVFNRATELARGQQDAKGAAALPVLPVGLGLSGTVARWSPSGVLLACRCWQLAGEDLPDRQDYATPGKSVNLASRALEPCRCMPIIGCRSDSQAHRGLCSCDGPV